MAKPILTDELWAFIEPLLPVHLPTSRGGRPRISDRAALNGILFVLKTGLPWKYLPRELGCGSGMSCWRRLREWQELGVWQRIHETVIRYRHGYDDIAWERASVDATRVPRTKGGIPLHSYRSRQAQPQTPSTGRSAGPPPDRTDLGG